MDPTSWREAIRAWKHAVGLALVGSLLLVTILCLAEFFLATRFESQFQKPAAFRAREHWLLRGERERGNLVEFANYGFHSALPGKSQSEVFELLRKYYPTEFDAKKVVWVLADREEAFFYRIVPNWAAILVLLSVLFLLLLVPSKLAIRIRSSSYSVDSRLADVLALIQVLAFDQLAHRSEDALRGELQGGPKSAASWSDVAMAHPELFRVKESGEHRVSLIARHVSDSSDPGRPVLSEVQSAALMNLAVDMHDREQQRSRGWQVWVPLIVALVAGTFTVVGASLSH